MLDILGSMLGVLDAVLGVLGALSTMSKTGDEGCVSSLDFNGRVFLCTSKREIALRLLGGKAFADSSPFISFAIRLASPRF